MSGGDRGRVIAILISLNVAAICCVRLLSMNSAVSAAAAATTDWIGATATVRTTPQVRIHAPRAVVLVNDTIHLHCVYELARDDALYSIKWYRGPREFYRYVPRDLVPVTLFPVPIIRIDPTTLTQFHNRISFQVTASDVLQFKCEVSGEGPSFNTGTDQVYIQVREIPKDPPTLVCDWTEHTIVFYCLSPDSSLAAIFQWSPDYDPLLTSPPLTAHSNGSVSVLKIPISLFSRIIKLTVSTNTVQCPAFPAVLPYPQCLCNIGAVYSKARTMRFRKRDPHLSDSFLNWSGSQSPAAARIEPKATAWCCAISLILLINSR